MTEICRRAQKALDAAEPGTWRLRVIETFREPSRQMRMFRVGRELVRDGFFDVIGPTMTNETSESSPLCIRDRDGNPAAFGMVLVVTDAASGAAVPKHELAWSVIPSAALAVHPRRFDMVEAPEGYRLELRGWKKQTNKGVLRGRP